MITALSKVKHESPQSEQTATTFSFNNGRLRVHRRIVNYEHLIRMYAHSIQYVIRINYTHFQDIYISVIREICNMFFLYYILMNLLLYMLYK